MKKIFLIGAGAAFFILFVGLAVKWYSGIEADLYKKDKKPADQLGIVAPDLNAAKNEKPTPSQTIPPPVPVNTAVTLTNQPNVVICNRDIEAFNPANASLFIGKFLKESQLTIGSKDPSSGMYFVTFKQKDGSIIRALCRAEDVGK
jgi:hypothetical protein